MLAEVINSNNSLQGKEIVSRIRADMDGGDGYEKEIASRLCERLQLDRPKSRVKPDVYYFVNHKKVDERGIDTVYLTRDRVNSPRDIPHELQVMDLVKESNGKRSFAGKTIRDWACWQNSSASHTFYMDGNDIVSTYIYGEHPIREDRKYFLTRNSKGVVLRRDAEGDET